MHQHRRKIRPAQLNVVAHAIGPGLARHTDDVGALAFRADVALFHNGCSFPGSVHRAAQRGRVFFHDTRPPRAWQSSPAKNAPPKWHTMSLAHALS